MTQKNIFRLFLICLGLVTQAAAQDAPNPEVVEYINTYRIVAIQEMQRTGVPASIKLAQGILETEAGKSDLVQRSNNHFGIKCKSTWTGEKVYHDDDERGECFRKYASADDSWKDHSDFLRNNPRYASLFSLDPMDYRSWAYGLKKAGYATNPRYPETLIRYIETYQLNDYSAIALGKLEMKPELTVEMRRVNAPTTPAGGSQATGVSAQPGTALPGGARPSYPSGEFMINGTRVIYVDAGTSMLALASKYSLRLEWLLDFNDLPEQTDILDDGQLVFLQRKRKHGQQATHTVAPGESLYTISQAEGIRLESLLALNHLDPGMQPAVGALLHLQKKAPERPALADLSAPATPEDLPAATPAAPAVPEQNPGIGSPLETERTLKPIRHIVQPKETLFSLARKYEVGQEQIKAWNKLEGNDLKAGQELVIYK